MNIWFCKKKHQTIKKRYSNSDVPEYSHNVLKVFLMFQIGCKNKWDTWSNQETPLCTFGDQFRCQLFSFFMIYCAAGNTTSCSINWRSQSPRRSGIWLAARNRANTRSTIFLATRRHIQPTSPTTSYSLFGPSPTRPMWRQKNWSIQAPPWWQNLEEHSVSFLVFPSYLFGMILVFLGSSSAEQIQVFSAKIDYLKSKNLIKLNH